MNTNTEQKTVYILQKDLPDFKAGTKYTRKKFFHFSGDEVSYFPNTKELDSTSVRGIHKDYVENNPEWFLPEQPKEWEIVARIDENAMTDIPNANIVKKGDIGWVYAELRNYPIHSVRRLSDGETFSVGEETEYGVISHFKVLDDTVNLEADVAASLNKESNRGGMAVRFHKNTLVNRMISQILKLPPPTPKEETIKVLEIKDGAYLNTDKLRCGKYYTFILNHPFPESKHEPIKKAIEDILNGKKDERLVPYSSYKMLFDQNQQIMEELVVSQEKWYNIGKGVALRNSPDYKTYIQSI